MSLKKAFQKRGLENAEPLLAHSFERVMPGRDYVASIRDFWRVCSGINETARNRVTKFLSEVLHVDKYPLTVLDRPVESETCKIAVLGVSYRQDVGDTRYSGSEVIVRKLTEMGADVVAHDPYVRHWWEMEKQDTYPSPDHSLARFFRNQERLSEMRMMETVAETLKGADAMVMAVRHREYLALDPDQIVETAGKPLAVIDCFGILNDDHIRRYFELGCEVKGLGRGHVKRIKDEVRTARS